MSLERAISLDDVLPSTTWDSYPAVSKAAFWNQSSGLALTFFVGGVRRICSFCTWCRHLLL